MNDIFIALAGFLTSLIGFIFVISFAVYFIKLDNIIKRKDIKITELQKKKADIFCETVFPILIPFGNFLIMFLLMFASCNILLFLFLFIIFVIINFSIISFLRNTYKTIERQNFIKNNQNEYYMTEKIVEISKKIGI